MKIVEALKKIKVNDKRIANNMLNITRYSSGLSIEKSIFETEAKQEEEVLSLIQANKDLTKETLKLKSDTEYTNLVVKTVIGGITYTLSNLLVLRRGKCKTMMETYKSLNDSAGETRLRSTSSVKDSDGKSPHVVRYYNEKKKNDGHRFWMDLYDEIDSRLEVINATTDLIEFPG